MNREIIVTQSKLRQFGSYPRAYINVWAHQNNFDKGHNLFIPKNINFIATIITLESIEKTSFNQLFWSIN